MISRSVDVAVIGAGLAGLSAAQELQLRGLDVAVLEQSDGPGGRVRSDRVDGCILDRGFQILLTSYPEVKRQLDLDALDVHAFAPGAVVHLDGQNHIVGDPLRDPRSLVPTLRSPIGSLTDKLTIVKLRQRVLRGDGRQLLRAPETSTRDHLSTLGFSPRMVTRFLRPLFAGIQLDPELETSSRMFDIIFRSLSQGESVVPAGGMGAIPQQLADRLAPGTIHYNTTVEQVGAGGVNTDDGQIHADQVIVATDGPAAHKLVGTRLPGSRAAACVWFLAETSPAPGRRILLDGSSDGPALNVAVMSDVAPNYAPAGKALIAASCPGTVGPGLEDAVRQQMRSWFGAVVDSWITIRVDRIPHGQPDQAPAFSPKRSVRVRDGLWVCGDHRDTGSIQGALYSGRRTAVEVLEELRVGGHPPGASMT